MIAPISCRAAVTATGSVALRMEAASNSLNGVNERVSDTEMHQLCRVECFLFGSVHEVLANCLLQDHIWREKYSVFGKRVCPIASTR